MTEPQLRTLRELAERPKYISPWYQPIQALVVAGFVRERPGVSGWYHITNSGRNYLAELDKKD
jgi:hypothetical protein